MTPFDAIAPHYSDLWSEHPDGRAQREEVWREIDHVFVPGQDILDLGCGIGDDALHLQQRGLRVTGIDSSTRMVAAAQARGIDARVGTIETLGGIHEEFDGVLSNFGAFNCVDDVRAAALQVARIVRPGGTFALCVLSRLHWAETVRALVRLDVRGATRRWSGRAEWRGMSVYYRSSAEWRRLFEPDFDFQRKVAIGGGDHQLYLFQRRRV